MPSVRIIRLSCGSTLGNPFLKVLCDSPNLRHQRLGYLFKMVLAQMIGAADLIKYALIVVSAAPILCAYPFVQKYFEKGVMIGSVKG